MDHQHYASHNPASVAFKNWDCVVEDWQTRRRHAILIGAVNPLAYLLILIAMTFTPVSYIGREISILVGALFGT